ncbi:zinc-binding alcohol dehydrogenase [Halomonas sabkhae]|uniref:zinc-dependent alcohol dehydrogenase n=1 Tax=Halomonas sabkhae TaxID=626223 RepID=UPI0025B38DF8|nr:zinc-binding alcohol dehydrogenase [Halomonas sabkhae]MDN3524821.1 zinc-binding alcohol dehydrogenase [Halomonas sabkhae]
MMQATAFWRVPGPSGELRAESLSAPGAGEVLVETRFSAISRGTESQVFHGRIPVSEYQRMRAPFQQGEFNAELKYGYASVGCVLEGPPALQGRNVFCLFPHQDRYVVPESAVVPLPDGLSPRRAVLGANMETAVNALWDAAPLIGDRICVIGAGVVGALVAVLASDIPGTEVCLVDTNPQRASLAEALGVTFREPDNAPAECDLVFHVSGSPAGLRQALTLAGNEARVVEMSWYGTEQVSVPLGQAFHSRRLTLQASQVGHLRGDRAVRWGGSRRLALALDLLGDPRFEALLEPDCAFEDLPRRMPEVASPASDILCQVVRYGPCAEDDQPSQRSDGCSV